MSDRNAPTDYGSTADGSRRGQTLVEFALLLPMLLVLLLGIADFGRIFQAGIVTEAAARNGAEAAAIERLRGGPPPSPVDPSYYATLHEIAARAACAETRTLPNTTYVPDEPSTTSVDEESCGGMPIIAVCVQDGQDPYCGDFALGFTGPAPGECSIFDDAWVPDTGGLVGSHSVEVRLCYHFTTLFNLDVDLPLGWGLTLGDVWLQRGRGFVVDCPPGDPAVGC
jgi:hypothetical protein